MNGYFVIANFGMPTPAPRQRGANGHFGTSKKKELKLHCGRTCIGICSMQLCETATRLADVRQRRRDGDAAEEEDEEEAGGRQSLKRSFLLKALRPIADYSAEYKLLHYVFDLSTWSDIGGKKGALQGVPMWQVMKGAPWTPQYWKIRHAAVLDLQAQCGYPVAFVTWAPFEWSAPYHEWILQQMSQLGRQRLGLAGPESLHLAHLLTELFREWLCGGARKAGDASALWQHPLFSGIGPNGRKVRVNFVGRLEFQDGKRKEATQDYHGRGAVHLHGLLFSEHIQNMKLEANSKPQCLQKGILSEATCSMVRQGSRGAAGLCSMDRASMTQGMTR